MFFSVFSNIGKNILKENYLWLMENSRKIPLTKVQEQFSIAFP